MKESPLDCRAYIEELRATLSAELAGVELEDEPGTDAAALTFVHPVHDATVILLAEAADETTPVASLLAAVVVGDWQDLQAQAGGEALFALNPRMMTCAVGLMRLNADEVAVVICRRVPAASVSAKEVRTLIEDMIWEYAHCAGWAEGSTPEPTPLVTDTRPRLIGSLDEL